MNISSPDSPSNIQNFRNGLMQLLACIQLENGNTLDPEESHFWGAELERKQGIRDEVLNKVIKAGSDLLFHADRRSSKLLCL